MPRLSLSAHPSTPCPLVRRIEIEAQRSAKGLLELKFALEGAVDRLRVPAEKSPARTDGLWRHTCFEAFIRASDSAYQEFNFAPSGEWAAYSFSHYRTGRQDLPMQPPTIVTRRTASRLETDASFSMPGADAGRLRLAISAVIEDDSGEVCYWALAHPEGKPDFHHESAFVLNLP